MDISSIIPIFIAILLFVFIFYRLLYKNSASAVPLTTTGGYTDSNVIAIKNANTIPQHITNAPSSFSSKPLTSFYIKSAYGGGFNGVDICTDMMLYTISLGYRYVVINVFFDVVNAPPATPSTTKTAVVGFSNIYSPMTNGAGRTVALTDFIQFIQENVFSPTAPNPADPFFLHILPAYQLGTSTDAGSAYGYNTQLNTQIEQSLSILQGSNRLSGPVTSQTTLGQIGGQLVITMDKFSLAGNMTQNLENMIGFNVVTASLQMAKAISPSSSNEWSVVLPFDTNEELLTSIPDYSVTYKTNKMNVTPICPWVSRFIVSSMVGKSNLGDYEQLFADNGGSAFITL